MGSIAKISVEKFDSKEEMLYDFDKAKGLDDNIKTICKKFGMPETTTVYGLKHIPTKTNLANYYITEKNFENIKHNDCLKVVFAMKYLVDRITSINVPEMRSVIFDDIMKLSVDPAFIEELADSRYHLFLIETFIQGNLLVEEQLPLLMTILHLFSKGHITEITQDFLRKILCIVVNRKDNPETIKYALFTLQKILINRSNNFGQWKEMIIRKLPLQEILPHMWYEQNPDLQRSALLLINTIIKLCKGDRRTKLIKEMNLSKTRENIYTSIIMKGNLEKEMEHELYVLQTYLLSLFAEALNSEINLNDNNLFNRDEFELCLEDIRRITILMDFDDEAVQQNPFYSIENLVLNGGNRNSSISLASMRSDESVKTIRSTSRHDSEVYENENTSINHLTLEALRYYKRNHYRHFHQSQIEGKLYEPGIFITGERVVKMLANLLHIGVDPPDSKSTFYLPVVFYCSRKTPFFLELFARTMWLLSHTRRDMKATTVGDYLKVMHILQKQVKMALDAKPKDFKSLTNEMSNTSFQLVMEEIQKEKEKEIQSLIDHHPCVQIMRDKFFKENKINVAEQRISCLLKGGNFPRVLEKKMNGSICVKLSKNRQDLMVYDVVDIKTGKLKFQEQFKIADITHVVIGKNCKHSNLCNPNMAFSIVINHEEKIKFVAKDERTACYWIDALLLLIGREEPDKLSKYYTQELNELVDMDTRLALLELQNVTIPKQPPAIPPPPLEPRPNLPPKPKLKIRNPNLTLKLPHLFS